MQIMTFKKQIKKKYKLKKNGKQFLKKKIN